MLKLFIPGFAALLAGSIAVVSPARAATTYDLVSDWVNSSAGNPNGTWSYLQGSNLLPFQASVNGGGPGYAPCAVSGCFLPLFYQPGGPGTDIVIHSVDPFNGNESQGLATLDWTAPVAGTIDISGYLYYDHPTVQRSNTFTLDLGNSALASGVVGYQNYYDQAHEEQFSFNNLSVTQGEILSLVLARLSSNDCGGNCGSQDALDLTITETATTPLPAALPMFIGGLGIMGMLGCRRKQKNPTALPAA